MIITHDGYQIKEGNTYYLAEFNGIIGNRKFSISRQSTFEFSSGHLIKLLHHHGDLVFVFKHEDKCKVFVDGKNKEYESINKLDK